MSQRRRFEGSSDHEVVHVENEVLRDDGVIADEVTRRLATEEASAGIATALRPGEDGVR